MLRINAPKAKRKQTDSRSILSGPSSQGLKLKTWSSAVVYRRAFRVITRQYQTVLHIISAPLLRLKLICSHFLMTVLCLTQKQNPFQMAVVGKMGHSVNQKDQIINNGKVIIGRYSVGSVFFSVFFRLSIVFLCVMFLLFVFVLR